MRKTLHIAGYLLIMLLSALTFGPALINQEDVRANLQDELSTALGRPVNIESIKISVLPFPTIEVAGFSASLGETEQETFAFDKAYAELALFELIQGKIAIDRLMINQTTLSEPLIAAVKRLFPATDSNSDSRALLPVTIKTVSLKDFYWYTTEKDIGPFQINAHWKDRAIPHLIEAIDHKRSINLAIKPKGDEWHFGLISHRGQFPWTLPVSLDAFSLSGYYINKKIQFEMIQLNGLGSAVDGKGFLSWQSGWELEFNAVSSELNLPAVMAFFDKEPIPGSASGNCKIHMQATSADQLVKHANYQCDLNYKNRDQQSPVMLKAKTMGEDTNMDLFVRDLVSPVGQPISLDAADISGVLHQQKFSILEAHLKAYEGEASITGQIDWSSQLAIQFASRTTALQLEPLLATFGEHKMSGALDSRCKGNLQGKNLTNALQQNLQLNCDFLVANGKVFDADLEQAARLIKDETDDKPKVTPFDNLSGKLTARQNHYDFEDLKITSSALAAAGNLSINSEKQLSGKLSVGVNRTGSILTVPLVVSGTTQNPSFMPTTASMTGAGAGTLLLGPGVGTAIGAKIGEAVGNLTNLFKRKPATD